MTIELQEVIPLGRSMQEYTVMFGLTEREMQLRIIDCGGGPSSFNCELNGKGGTVVSIDPVYSFSADEIQVRIDQTFEEMIEQAQNNMDKFVWNSIKNIRELRQLRLKAMKLFIEDFELGKAEGRYLDRELPRLPFDNGVFDLALSSHFLFLYSNILSYEFHREAITEMLRIAREVRIFPLVDLNSRHSVYVAEIADEFKKSGYLVDVVKTGYEFQKGANEYMMIKRGFDV